LPVIACTFFITEAPTANRPVTTDRSGERRPINVWMGQILLKKSVGGAFSMSVSVRSGLFVSASGAAA